ncbi:hypothetical protein NSERKGN1266_42420 [Nocardia seriolae]|nr:hypothetical protein NSERKGN1266_42420 [Nocardia seriolae]BEK95777.1 hypothetical protein NSER024013_36830 [Nocardia seriolae]
MDGSISGLSGGPRWGTRLRGVNGSSEQNWYPTSKFCYFTDIVREEISIAISRIEAVGLGFTRVGGGGRASRWPGGRPRVRV